MKNQILNSVFILLIFILPSTFTYAQKDVYSSIGPENIAGKITTVAVNPGNPNQIWAGTRQGGLWVSNLKGQGNSWKYVPTPGINNAPLPVRIIKFAPKMNAKGFHTIYVGTGLRVFDIAHPNLSFRQSGRTEGLIWSDDGGATWQHPFAGTIVEDIAILPDTSKIFVATDSDLLVSNDGGNSFHPTRFGANNSLFIVRGGSVLVHPDPNIRIVYFTGFVFDAFAQLYTKGLFISYDNGNTFVETDKITRFQIAPNYADVAGNFSGKLAMSPTNPDILYLSSFDSKLYKSIDGGKTWRDLQILLENKEVFAVSPLNPDFLYCSNRNGEHLELIDSHNRFAGATATQLTDPNAGKLGLINYGDEGTNKYVHQGINQIVFDPTNPNTMFLATDGGVFEGQRGTDFVGRNGGLVTTEFNRGFGIGSLPLPNIQIPQNLPLMTGGTMYNGLLAYNGDGYTKLWSRNRTTSLNASWGIISQTPNTANKFASFVEDNSVIQKTFISDNNALNWGLPNLWRVPAADIAENTDVMQSPMVNPSSAPNVLYAGRRNVWKSIDFGEHWTQTPFMNFTNPKMTINAMAVDQTGTNIIVYNAFFQIGLFASGGSFFFSMDEGLSWKRSVIPFPIDLVTDIYIDSPPNIAFATAIVNKTQGVILKSTESGAVWQDITGNFPKGEIPKAICPRPNAPNAVFVGTETGLYLGLENGGFWTWHRVVDPDFADFANVTDLTTSKDSFGNSFMIISTFGRGAYLVRFG